MESRSCRVGAKRGASTASPGNQLPGSSCPRSPATLIQRSHLQGLILPKSSDSGTRPGACKPSPTLVVVSQNHRPRIEPVGPAGKATPRRTCPESLAPRAIALRAVRSPHPAVGNGGTAGWCSFAGTTASRASSPVPTSGRGQCLSRTWFPWTTTKGQGGASVQVPLLT